MPGALHEVAIVKQVTPRVIPNLLVRIDKKCYFFFVVSAEVTRYKI